MTISCPDWLLLVVLVLLSVFQLLLLLLLSWLFASTFKPCALWDYSALSAFGVCVPSFYDSS
jgi:hypothetical protein